MTNSHRFHNLSMVEYDFYLIHRVSNPNLAAQHLRKALDFESRAANLLFSKFSVEPTRSRLFLSAARMADMVSEPLLCEQLIAAALAGNPPHDLRVELQAFYDTTSAYRHLTLDGINLKSNEVQLIMAGGYVGHGFILKDDFDIRMNSVQTSLIRVTQARRNMSYTKTASESPIASSLKLFLGVGEAASYSVTLRVGLQETLGLEGYDDNSIVNDFMTVVNAISNEDDALLESIIPDKRFRETIERTFEQISPDGKRVQTVGIGNATFGMRQLPVKKSSSKARVESGASKSESVKQDTGTLSQIERIRTGKDRVRVVRSDGTISPNVAIPDRLIDTVASLYSKRVVITYFALHGEGQLSDIDLASDRE